MNKKRLLQMAFDDAKRYVNHFPDNGRIEYRRGSGYTVWYRDIHNRLQVYCWLGTFERGMRFIRQAKESGIPNFSSLRVGA